MAMQQHHAFVVTYGERFKALRARLWKGTLLELARRLDSPYPATIYNIEKQWRAPTLPTIERHAQARPVTLGERSG